MSQQQIALDQLTHSNLNARRYAEKADPALKASIHNHGLLQGLVVKQNGDQFEVIAGGRRLTALKELQQENKLPADWAVPCNIIETDDAKELSLAENTVRENMHPADEFETFAELVKSGEKPEAISVRFGTTEKHVNQRLKMAKVHPDIIKQYRDGKITLDVVMAFTISDDQEHQLKIFKGLNEWELKRAESIKDKVTKKMVKPDAAEVKLVGLQAYKDAGGTIIEDLFGEATYLADKKLLDRLVADTLNAEVQELKDAGWGWVEVVKTQYGWHGAHAYDRVKAKTKEEKSKAGCVVVFNKYQGKVTVEKGLKKKKAEKKKETPSHSSYVMPSAAEYAARDLRQEIAEVALLGQPAVLMDLLTFGMALEHFDEGNYGSGAYGFNVSISQARYHHNSGIEELSTKAKEALAAAQAALQLEWLKPEKEAAKFAEFLTLSHEQKQAILVFCLAHAVDVSDADDAIGDEEQPALAVALGMTGVSVAEQWRPTKGSYLGKLTEKELRDLGEQLAGKEWAATNKGSTVEAMADDLEQMFANPGEQTNAVEVAQWLPEGMAFPVPAEIAPKKTKAKNKAA